MNELNSLTQTHQQHDDPTVASASSLSIHIIKENQSLKGNDFKKTLLKNALRENLLKRKKVTNNSYGLCKKT